MSAKPDWKPARRAKARARRKPAALIMSDLWRTGMGPCAMRAVPNHRCEGDVLGHHVITQQALRKRGLDEFLWDRRNRLPLCERAHLSHHTAAQRVPRALLPPPAYEFAAELDLTWLLERVYPVGVSTSGRAGTV